MRLTFLGAARMVTGSSYLVETEKVKFLVDCGMFQGAKSISALNHRDFLYDPSSIDFVLLSHAHIDHSGLIPKLCKAGFKGPIYTTKVTAELCRIMLPDSAHIQEFDTAIANRKGVRAGKNPIEPLYTIDDAYACLQQFSPVAYNNEFSLTSEISVRFQDAGHILGSSVLELWISENGQRVKLLFSGDLGQPNQPILKDPAYVEEADYIITESTYGNRLHEQYDKEERLAEIVNDTVKRGGNIIIPSFAVGRTQTILYYLHKLLKAGKIPDTPVIIDSPLAISATDIFMQNTQEYDSEAAESIKENDNPLQLPKLTFTKTPEESRSLNNLDDPAIIISASGMADAGRILHHLKHNLWRPESSIVFVGYQAQGSLGRRLLEGAQRVKVMGEEIRVKAQIHNLEGFSAHADKEQLLEWLSRFKSKPVNVFIVHGEYDMSKPFSDEIESRLKYSTHIPRFGDTAVIQGHEWSIVKSEVVPEELAVKQMYDYLEQMESNYRLYRNRLERLTVTDTSKIPEAVDRLKEIYNYINKKLKDL